MMRMKVIVILILVSICASKFVSYNKAVELFKKYVRKELNKDEEQTVKDVVEILKLNQHWSKLSLSHAPQCRTMLYCFGCRVLAAVLFDAVLLGFPEKLMIDIATKLCTLFHVETREVCQGVLKLNLPILAYIIKKTPEARPRTFCGLLLQNDDDPDACAFDDPRFEWQVNLPDFDKTAIPQNSTAKRFKPLTAALITDAHLDPLYKPHGVADCGEPTCCRQNQSSHEAIEYRFNESVYNQTFVTKNGEVVLDLSFVPKLKKVKRDHRFKPTKNAAPVGYWGDYRNCDTPLWTFDAAVDRIARAHKGVNVVYYVGDTIDHHIWETTYSRNINMNRYLVDKLRKSFGDRLMIVPIVGNHESQPINQFAPASIKNNMNTTWLYKFLIKKWKLNNDARVTFWKRGAYSKRIKPGLRAVVVNTNVAYRYNWWMMYDPLEAKDHLDWLVDVLYKAELTGEKVHILTHIPPGVSDLTHTWTREYNRIINRFASTIAAEFNGHMHSDEFKVYFDSEGTPTRVAWNGGGLTTYSNFNANYKIIKFHKKTHEPTNIVNYIFNLTAANLKPKRKPHWYKLYDFKRQFHLSNLSPSSMAKLVSRMASDSSLASLYADFAYKMSDARPKCDRECRFSYLCNAVVTVLWDRKKCDELKRSN